MLLKIRPDLLRFMETFNHQQQHYTGSGRLLDLFSQPESTTTTTTATNGVELNEDYIFSTSFDSPISPNPNFTTTTSAPNPSSTTTAAAIRLFADRNLGVLAILPDRNPNPNRNLMPKFSISCFSSAMMIPPSAKPKEKTAEKVYHQSAPVSIPEMNWRKGIGGGGMVTVGGGEEEEMMMMPPHEIVARREGKGREASPMTTFSVLEGVGRTLKGRDLRRVRNAVFRTTGFED